MRPPAYADIADFDEDKRIDVIGHRVMVHREVVAFITDAEEGKADRYIEKLRARFPAIKVLWRGPGPVANTVTVKVGPPEGDA